MALASGRSITDGNRRAAYDPANYAAFGQQGLEAYNQGWHPTLSNNGATTYQNNYDPAFKGVLIDGKPTGHLEIVGNKNGLFNVHIADEKGNVKQVIMASQPYSQVDNYLRNGKSIIQQRMNRIQPQAAQITVAAK